MTALLLILASNGSGRMPCMAWADCATKRLNLLIVGERPGKSSSSLKKLMPKGICKEITDAIAQFWWGDDKETKKMHWMAWWKLCVPKNQGHMGFL